MTLSPRAVHRYLTLALVAGLLAASCSSTADTSATATAPTDTPPAGATDQPGADGTEPEPDAGNDDNSTDAPPTDSSPDSATADPLTDNDGLNENGEVIAGEVRDFGPSPEVPTGPSDPQAQDALDRIIESLADADAAVQERTELAEELALVAATEDPRFAWALSDLLRFTQGAGLGERIVETMEGLTGTSFSPLSPWGDSVDHLIAWDYPAPDDYPSWKASLFGAIDERWEPLFDGAEAHIDLRYVSWGGVFIDDRELDDTLACPRGCIPALDDPAVTDAEGGAWFPDDGIVFGVVIGDEARAYPKNQMEVHEMVNDTLGGRRIAIPYCTLCGSAQAYLTDELGDDFEPPVLRTSGLLIRSNKMMYELNTRSFVDTFIGEATSGPLAKAGVRFNQVSVVRSTWKAWRQAHPETTIIAEDGGLGRTYAEDPLRGRDDNGPIFPIGDTDPRLPVQESVLGVTTAQGDPLAFHVGAARAALLAGETVSFRGVEVVLDGSGVRAVDNDGNQIESHEAFWFAWSQFQPETSVWPLDA